MDWLNDALVSIGKEYDETPEQVLQNIQEMIDEASQNPDPAVQEAWSRIPYRGERPEAREFLLLFAAMMQMEQYAS